MTPNAHRWLMQTPGEPLIREQFDPFPPAAGEVIIAISGCGVCHTDLGYYYDGVRTKHELPLALGHEISGKVVACGPDVETWQNHAVIVPSVIPCYQCDRCKRGKPAICANQKMPGNDIHGGFASHIKVPAAGLCKVDERRLAAAGMSLADVSVVADAATTPFQAVTRSGLTDGDLAIVVGVGGVGGYTAQIAAAFGATVVAIDLDPRKLENIAKYGAALTLNPAELQTRELKKTVGKFAEANGLRSTEWFVFECSGTAAGQQTAYSLITYGSTLSVVGFTMEKVEVRLSNLMAFDARAIGNWGCPPELYPATLDLVLDGKVQLLPFVEQRPLEDINQVFAEVHAGKMNRRAILIPET